MILQTALEKWVVGQWNETSTEIWIGAHDISREGTFTWKHSGKNISFNNWHPNEPNNGGGGTIGEDCAYLDGGNWLPLESRFVWKDLECHATNYNGVPLFAICELNSKH